MESYNVSPIGHIQSVFKTKELINVNCLNSFYLKLGKKSFFFIHRFTFATDVFKLPFTMMPVKPFSKNDVVFPAGKL